MALDQENEHRQMKHEAKIRKCLNTLYELLLASDDPQAEDQAGFIAKFKAYWEGEHSTFDEEAE